MLSSAWPADARASIDAESVPLASPGNGAVTTLSTARIRPDVRMQTTCKTHRPP